LITHRGERYVVGDSAHRQREELRPASRSEAET